MKRPRRGQFVTREMLADLRDEIEEVLDAARKACEETTKAREHAIDWDRKEYQTTLALRTRVQRLETVLGLDLSTPHLHALAEPVTWSYFHVWIARMNQRLDKIEQTMGGHDGKATGIDRTD